MLVTNSDKSHEKALIVPENANREEAPKGAFKRWLAKLFGEETRTKIDNTLEPLVEGKMSELSLKHQAQLLSILESRLSKKHDHYERPKGISFADVKRALEVNPDLMRVLYKMELTGGMPDIVADEKEVFVFADCMKEIPDSRRDLIYEQASEMAQKLGVEMISENTYRSMQENGEFDLSGWSHIKTPDETRGAGGTLGGYRTEVGGVIVRQGVKHYTYVNGGLRGELRVPKALRF